MKTKSVAAIIISFLLVSGCATSASDTPPAKTDVQFLVKQESQLVQSVGAPYEITVDNCDGARDSEKVEERSRTYFTELNLEVSREVAVEIGGNIEVAKIMLSEQIGIALGIRIGTQTESKSSVKIITPAGQRTITHLQWKEVWTTGTISVLRPDGSYVDVLPFSALNSLTLEQLDSRTVNCETGAIVENGATAQISTPTATIKPLPTRALTSTPTNTSTSIPEGSAVIFIPNDICDAISLSECRCLWTPQVFHSDSDSPMKDTWTLQNLGSGNLILESEDTTCPECFVVQHNPQIGNVIIPNGYTQLSASYYWDRDPNIDTEHFHTATIYSNAGNCPVLEISIRINYK